MEKSAACNISPVHRAQVFTISPLVAVVLSPGIVLTDRSWSRIPGSQPSLKRLGRHFEMKVDLCVRMGTTSICSISIPLAERLCGPLRKKLPSGTIASAFRFEGKGAIIAFAPIGDRR
jgi:hypothetical protein